MRAGIDAAEALSLLRGGVADTLALVARAGAARVRDRGLLVDPCAIVNAKSGDCGQDCAFCAQSSRSTAAIEKYPLLDGGRLYAAAAVAADLGANRFSVVTSGRAVRRPAELAVIADLFRRIGRELPVTACASLGLLEREALARLVDAGMTRYHHNLECAESFFARICSTREWRASLDTIEAARSLGLELCVGGIFGLGESVEQRVELLEAIRATGAESAPLNFLHPIPGTPLAGVADLTPLDCVKIVAVARLMMPDREVRVCGGREHNLRDLQAFLLAAGADGLMVGGYLTTRGRTVADDLQMIADAGFAVKPRAARR